MQTSDENDAGSPQNNLLNKVSKFTQVGIWQKNSRTVSWSKSKFTNGIRWVSNAVSDQISILYANFRSSHNLAGQKQKCVSVNKDAFFFVRSR
jgi:hypothetical protein